MSKKQENTAFTCLHCGRQVPPSAGGGYRNHCPHCLWSRHVDIVPGDRRSGCGALMEPVGMTWHSRKGHQLIHRCTRCGVEKVNRLDAGTEQPDSMDAVVRLMRRQPGGHKSQ